MKDDEGVDISKVFAEIHPPLTASQAFFESERCLECGGPNALAPCVAACPSDVDVPRFIREIRDGDPTRAGRTVFEANVLGGSCARVCPVEELCEGACVMHREGRRPVEIGRLQRYATDHALDTPMLPGSATGFSVGVIGAGPAGLACAAKLAELGHSVTVYERDNLPGGLVTHAIAPYKQKVEPIPEETERIRQLGVKFCYGVEVGKDISIVELRERHDSIFLGAGMGKDTPAGLEGEEMAGVWESLEFIRALKLQTPPVIGRKVAVIGGGNTAIDIVREAIRLGAEEVTLVYRRSEEQMPAFHHEVVAAREEGVHFEFLTAPLRFLGGHQVTGIECQRMELGEPDASGRARPVPIAGSEFILEADTVVKAIGQAPRSDLLQSLGVLVKGSVVAIDANYQTSAPGVYAGGDCINGGSTVVEAVAHGKAAALSIHAALGGGFSLPREPFPTKIDRQGPVERHYQGGYYIGMSKGLCKGCLLCVESCPKEILFLDGKQKIEVTDVDACVFCGMCEARCPDFAIWVSKGQPDHPVESEAMRRLAV